MPYGIALISKYGGGRTVLGSQFASLEARQAFIDKEVCTRCNQTEVVHIPDGCVWQDSRVGFQSIDIRRRVSPADIDALKHRDKE